MAQTRDREAREDWTMGELEDYQLEELARQVQEGNTSGRLDDDNANIYWELRYNVWKVSLLEKPLKYW